MMSNGLQIRKMIGKDAPLISAAFSALGWHKPVSQYERYFAEQEFSKRVVLVAFVDSDLAAYGNIVWESRYASFKDQRIPEITDLNVLPHFRRRGIATALMDRFEAMIFERCDTAGIGVGLYPDYGAAQKLYVRRGYVPDGRGITFQEERVRPGQQVVADDDLVLWFTKKLVQEEMDE